MIMKNKINIRTLYSSLNVGDTVWFITNSWVIKPKLRSKLVKNKGLPVLLKSKITYKQGYDKEIFCLYLEFEDIRAGFISVLKDEIFKHEKEAKNKYRSVLRDVKRKHIRDINDLKKEIKEIESLIK